jgi:catechol 2,3-dioxygenase-like lactoylglutathione lyase family enzyme
VTARFAYVEIVVSDLERSIAFQERALGALRGPAGPGGTVTRVGHTRFLLVESPCGGRPRVLRADAPGAYHVCVSVPDVHAAYAQLARAGVGTSAPPAELLPGLWSVYLRDPDGVHYQLLQVAGDTRIHHVARNVADLDRSLAWYEAQLDTRPVYRGSASGAQAASMLEVPDASYDVALLPFGGISLELMQWTSPPGNDAPRGERDVGAMRLGLDLAGTGALADPDGLRLEHAPHDGTEGAGHVASPSTPRSV